MVCVITSLNMTAILIAKQKPCNLPFSLAPASGSTIYLPVCQSPCISIELITKENFPRCSKANYCDGSLCVEKGVDITADLGEMCSDMFYTLAPASKLHMT